MITLKSRREIRLMKVAGQLVAEAHATVREMIKPGVTTRQLDAAVDDLFARHAAEPLFKGFPGKTPFPAATCTSVNEEIVHGIPGDRPLQEGDIISIDTGCRVKGWCGDSAWTYAVGEIDEEKRRLMEVGEATLRTAVDLLAKKQWWSEVADEMAAVVHAAGFSVVEQFVGHGIGREMHEPPQVPNFRSDALRYEDFELKPGLVLAIEPMINAGTGSVEILDDHWTAVTGDGRPSVHFEHTVALTADGPELLTAGVGGPRWM